jgi:hypothetical protein
MNGCPLSILVCISESVDLRAIVESAINVRLRDAIERQVVKPIFCASCACGQAAFVVRFVVQRASSDR